jgi:hypothetical protein
MKYNIFKAGKYWIGDPCYAVKSENWSKLLAETGYFGLEEVGNTGLRSDGTFYYNGGKCFAGQTKYGDGTYFDNNHREYGVDAGLLGIMPFSACDGNSLNGGNIVDFEQDFRVNYNSGLFEFGHVIIQTDDSLLESDDEDDLDDFYFEDDDEDEF